MSVRLLSNLSTYIELSASKLTTEVENNQQLSASHKQECPGRATRPCGSVRQPEPHFLRMPTIRTSFRLTETVLREVRQVWGRRCSEVKGITLSYHKQTEG